MFPPQIFPPLMLFLPPSPVCVGVCVCSVCVGGTVSPSMSCGPEQTCPPKPPLAHAELSSLLNNITTKMEEQLLAPLQSFILYSVTLFSVSLPRLR